MSLRRRGGLGAGLGSWGRGGGEHSMALDGVLGEGWGPGTRTSKASCGGAPGRSRAPVFWWLWPLSKHQRTCPPDTDVLVPGQTGIKILIPRHIL